MRSSEVSARLSGPRETDSAFVLNNGPNKGKSDGDSSVRSNARKYVTATRVRSLAAQLTDHDGELIDMLQRVRYASGAQIRSLLWGDGGTAARSSRRQLAKLTGNGVIRRMSRRVGGVRSGSEGYVYSLDLAGQHIAGQAIKRRPAELSLLFIDHALALTGCYVQLKLCESRGELELLHFEAEPACWRNYSGPGGGLLTLKPDAFVITATGEWEDRWFLEVDRDSERPVRIRRKAEAHVAYWQSGREQAEGGISPRVLWIAPGEKRASQLVTTLGSLDPETWQLFQVTTDERFAGSVTAGAGAVSEVGP